MSKVSRKETFIYDDLALKLFIPFGDCLEKRNISAVSMIEN